MTTRDRLVRFYEKYAPEKLATVDKALTAYKGREEEMFATLVSKYGAEPTDMTSEADSGKKTKKEKTPRGDAGSDHRSRLVRFYEKYAPEKLATVDKALTAYKGREEEMFETLVTKYGAEPTDAPADGESGKKAAKEKTPRGDAGSDHRGRLVRFYEKYAPEKLATVDKALVAYKGREEEMFETLVTKYGAEPTDAPADGESGKKAAKEKTPRGEASGGGDHRGRLVRFYEKYAPEKLATVDKALVAYKGREEEMFQTLVTKYGAEPTDAPADGESGKKVVKEKTPRGDAGSDHRGRLVRFYEKYAPEKLATVDKALVAYKGREEEMFETLVTKYGAEPTDAPGDDGREHVVASKKAPAEIERSLDAVVDDDVGAPATDHRSRLVRFYEKYAPEKLATVDKALVAYKGREEEMFATLVTKYGAEPTDAPIADDFASEDAPAGIDRSADVVVEDVAAPATDHRSRLVRFYEKYAPEKLATVDKALVAYKGQEEELFATLVGKYGAEPKEAPPEVSSRRAINSVSEETVSNLKDESAIARRGDEKEALKGVVPAPVAAPVDPMRDVPWDFRLSAFLQFHGKPTDKVDVMLSGYRGNEDRMLAALERKFGPGPRDADVLREWDDTRSKLAPNTIPEASPLPIHSDPTVPPDGGVGAPSPAIPQAPHGPMPLASGAEHPTGATPPVALHAFTAFSEPERAPPPAEAVPTPIPVPVHVPQESVPETTPALTEEPAAPTLSPSSLPEAPNQDVVASGALIGEETAAPAPVEVIPIGGDHLAASVSNAPPPADTTAEKTPFSKRMSADADMPVSKGRQREQHIAKECGKELQGLYEQYARDRMSHLKPLLELYKGREMELVRLSCADFGAPIPAEVVRLSREPTDGQFIQSSGKLTISLRHGRSFLRPPNADESQRRGDYQPFLTSTYQYEAIVLANNRELFRTPKRDAPELTVKWPEAASTFMLLLDGSLPTVRVVVACNHCFCGEITLHLAALPACGERDFQLQARQGEQDTFILSHKNRLGWLCIAWSFAPDAGMAELRRARLAVGNTSQRSLQPQRAFDSATQDELIRTDPWRQRIGAMYCRYLPHRLEDVEEICTEYRGRESVLLDALVVKYGCEPDPKEFRARVERILYHYAPDRVPESRLIADQGVGREEDILARLSSQYGHETGALYSVPPTQVHAAHPLSDRHRIRLTRWLMLRVPRRVGEVDYLLARFTNRETTLFAILNDCLGAEPQDTGAPDSVRSRYLPTSALRHFFSMRKAPPFLKWVWASEGARAEESHADHGGYGTQYLQFRTRLERFYRHYNPIKVADVEETLHRWRGREQMLFDALVHKYGAEPAVGVTGRAAGRKGPTDPSSGAGIADEGGAPASGRNRILSPGLLERTFAAEVNAEGHATNGFAGGMRPPAAQDASRHLPLYTPSGSVSHAGLRQVLHEHYQMSNPTMLGDIDAILQRFTGREEVLVDLLRRSGCSAASVAPPRQAENVQTLSSQQYADPRRYQ